VNRSKKRKTQKPKARVASSRSSLRTLIVLSLIVAGVVIAGVVLTGRRSTEPPSPSSVAGADTIVAVERLPMPSTLGGDLRLDQLHGSKVVLYFFEGSG
jgi:hypothetical protein